MGLLSELKRRNVFRVALLYIITGWLVIQVAETILPLFAVPDWVLRAVVLLFVLGFVPALVFSWVYELTPEGVKKESEIDREQSVTPQTARKIDRMTLGLLVLLTVFVVTDRFMPREAADSPEPATVADQAAPAEAGTPAETVAPDVATDHSIAVLPFDDFSQAGDQAHFSNGLADTILHVLAQVDGLRVAARTSSFAFTDGGLDVQTIGQRLKVATVLEGSVQKAGNRVRVIAQLIDVSDGSHLWSQTFDRELNDIFAVQDEIAQSVVTALSGSEAESLMDTGTENPVAYEFYLRGNEALRGGTTEHFIAADGFFRQAINEDPAFAAAQAAIALNYTLRGDMDRQDALDERLPFIQRSLELNPDLALGHALLGEALYNREEIAGDGFAADEVVLIESEYSRALDLNPNLAWAWAEWARLKRALRRYDEALALMVKAVAIDPMSPAYRLEYARTLHRLGRFADAREELETGLRIDPVYVEVHDEMARLENSAYGRPDRGLAWAKIAAELDKDSWTSLYRQGVGRLRLGQRERLLDLTGDMRERGVGFAGLFKSFYELEWGTSAGIREALGDDYDSDNYAFFKAIVAYRNGDFAAALQGLRSVVDDATTGGVAALDLGNAVNSAHLMSLTGDETGARELAELVISESQKHPLMGEAGYGFSKMLAHYVLDDQAAGRAAVDELLAHDFLLFIDQGNDIARGIMGEDYPLLAEPVRARRAEMTANLEAVEKEVRAEFARLRSQSLVNSG
jgi:TolB-like protein/tetratricopeptide (TPR) repeat protein